MLSFVLGIVVTLLIGSIYIIIKQRKELNQSKSNNKTTAPIINLFKRENDEDDEDNENEQVDNSETEREDAYPSPALIPIEWIDSIYKIKNTWVNSIATTNLFKAKKYDLGEVTVIANCKFIDTREDGYVLILEDVFTTIKTEVLKKNKIPDEEVRDFLGYIVKVKGISKDGKIKILEIQKQKFARSII